MVGARILLLMLVGTLSLAAVSSRTDAQCRLCSTPTTTHDDAATGDDIKIEVETRMNFDRLILIGQGEGVAMLRPDGSTSAVGAVTNVSPRAAVATVVVHGEANRAIRVELPRRVELYSLRGSRIYFDEVVSDLPSLPRLDSAGNLTFRFGGRLHLSGDADGDYRGDLPITVEYL